MWNGCTVSFNDFIKTRVGSTNLNLFGIFFDPHKVKSVDTGSNISYTHLDISINGAKVSTICFNPTRPRTFNLVLMTGRFSLPKDLFDSTDCIHQYSAQ